MSDTPPKKTSTDKHAELPAETDSFERYDLAGYKHQPWTVRARKKLWKYAERVFSFGKKTADTTLPGNDETIGEKLTNTPGKGADFLEAKLDDLPLANKLKIAQTEKEYAQQELIREQTKNTKADTRGKNLKNLEHELDIIERFKEITDGKTNVYFDWDEDQPKIIIGNLPGFEPIELIEAPEENDTKVSFSQLDSLDVLELTTRTKNLLLGHGITGVVQLIQLPPNEIVSLQGIGLKTLSEIDNKMRAIGYPLCTE